MNRIKNAKCFTYVLPFLARECLYLLRTLKYMASVQLVLVKHKIRKDGTIPIAVRIIKNRKPTYDFTGETVNPKDWNDVAKKVKRSHPNSVRLNNFLLKKLSEAHASVLEAESSDQNLTTTQLKKRIRRKGHVSFYQQAEARIKSKEAEEVFSVSRAEQSILNNIKKFHKKETLSFQDITLGFLNRFKTYCKAELGQSKRTVTNQLIFIRTVFNIAINDGLLDAKHYPFAGEKEKIRLGSGHKNRTY